MRRLRRWWCLIRLRLLRWRMEAAVQDIERTLPEDDWRVELARRWRDEAQEIERHIHWRERNLP